MKWTRKVISLIPNRTSARTQNSLVWHYPETGSTVAVTGRCRARAYVDAKGNLTNLQVLSEEPPLLGFGDAALSDFSVAKFIPAFRNGQPVESNVKIPVYYKPSAAPAQSE